MKALLLECLILENDDSEMLLLISFNLAIALTNAMLLFNML